MPSMTWKIMPKAMGIMLEVSATKPCASCSSPKSGQCAWGWGSRWLEPQESPAFRGNAEPRIKESSLYREEIYKDQKGLEHRYQVIMISGAHPSASRAQKDDEQIRDEESDSILPRKVPPEFEVVRQATQDEPQDVNLVWMRSHAPLYQTRICSQKKRKHPLNSKMESRYIGMAIFWNAWVSQCTT